MNFGKIEYFCDDHNAGEPTVLKLTFVGEGDEEILFRHGISALRQRRILRLTQEAEEQGCLLCFEDLRTLLSTSLSTLKRDVTYLERHGRRIPLRKRRKNGIGGKVNGKDISYSGNEKITE